MSFPVSPILRRSTSIRWLSVPPDTISNPLSINASANTEAFFTICFWYSLNSGVNASFKHTAFAAITCIKGPPWIPGKIALLKLYFLFTSSLDKIIPPLGPRSVLWVVVVVTCAYGIGLSWRPAATKPAIWAISTINTAPTSSAISRILLKSIFLAYALAPAIIIFGWHSKAISLTLS